MTVTVKPSQLGYTVALDMTEIDPSHGTVYLTHYDSAEEAEVVAGYIRRLLDPADSDHQMGRYLVEAWQAVRR